MSRTDQLPIDAFIASGVLFCLSAIIISFDRFIKMYKTIRIDLPLHFLLILYAWANEYWVLNNSTYTLLLSLSCLSWSIIKEGIGLFYNRRPFSSTSISYLELMIPPTSGTSNNWYSSGSHLLWTSLFLIIYFDHLSNHHYSFETFEINNKDNIQNYGDSRVLLFFWFSFAGEIIGLATNIQSYGGNDPSFEDSTDPDVQSSLFMISAIDIIIIIIIINFILLLETGMLSKQQHGRSVTKNTFKSASPVSLIA